MFRIGEFSKLTQVTVRMLRYYDKMGLLKPDRTDPWTGYRMYSSDQIPVLNKIIYLRDCGFNVTEIAAVLKSDGSQSIAAQLERKHLEIEQNIRAEQEKLRKIELSKEELLSRDSELHYHINIKPVPACPVLSLRRKIPDYYAEGMLWKELSEYAKRERIQVSEETFTIYHDMEYKEENVDVELCAIVRKPVTAKEGFTYRITEAVPCMACTMAYGPFSNIAGAYQTFARWLQENGGYQMGIQSRQIVHRGPWNEEDPDHYLTEIQIPLKQI